MEGERFSEVDRSLEDRQQSTKEVNAVMKLSERGMDVFIGAILGVTIGLHYPLDAHKLLFVLLSVI